MDRAVVDGEGPSHRLFSTLETGLELRCGSYLCNTLKSNFIIKEPSV